MSRNSMAAVRARGLSAAETRAVCEDVEFAIPRMALRVPWRADCLVQALAGQAWLTAQGAPSEIRIGASNSEAEGFAAHAWLACGDRIVLGGDISGYETLLDARTARDPR